MSNTLDTELAARLAGMALDSIRREYPNHVSHWLNDDTDARTPRELHPAFFGCLDWHSAVHNHWLLARLLSRFPEAGFARPAQALLEEQLTARNIAGECEYLATPGRQGFERPYGWAWLLALDAELAPWPALRSTLGPLVGLIAEWIGPWLGALPYPVRAGEHSNTAFGLALMLDWARESGNRTVEEEITDAAGRFYGEDRGASFAWEPSGHDFISPVLAEADVMSRVLAPDKFGDWLERFLPAIPAEGNGWLTPAVMPESTDYKLAHLPGVNLSRSWMLETICSRLPETDPRRAVLAAAAQTHVEAGLSAVLRADYGASHWLPTFAVRALT